MTMVTSTPPPAASQVSPELMPLSVMPAASNINKGLTE